MKSIFKRIHMSNEGSIILVEDDHDDIEIITKIITTAFPQNALMVFKKLEDVFQLLGNENEKPFLIICDNNWRNKNLKKLEALSSNYPGMALKRIPFVFFSSSPIAEEVNEAFEHLNVQGYFNKESDYGELKNTIISIVNYWKRSQVPVSK